MMTLLRKIKISHRLSLLIILFIAGLVTITSIILTQYRTSLLEDKGIQTEQLVQTAHSLLENYYNRFQSGEFTEQDARKRALETISKLRYAGTNYFWVNDYNARMIMHPIKPALDGKDLSDFADPNGKKIFIEMAKIVTNGGEGFVPYQWPKPGAEEPVDKISFVKGFEPWKMIIGTGIYIDDVNHNFYNVVYTLIIITLIILIPIITISILINRSISSPINATTKAMDNISKGEGDLTQRLRTDGHDEVANLALAFNTFIENNPGQYY